MRKIIYYVAISLDGFIAAKNEDISGFAYEGDGVQQYLQDLQGFDTVIMGRKTYEFGYAYGLEPGQPAYPHMQHYIFSKTLKFENQHEKIHICEMDLGLIQQLKQQKGTDIYLCGGGEFAGWLLKNEMIEEIKIKLNPLIINEGIPLFHNVEKQYKLELLETKHYEKGLQIMSYKIIY